MTNPLNNLCKYPRRPFREKSQSSLSNKICNFNDFEVPSLKDLDVSLSETEFNDLIEDVTNNMASKNLAKYSNGLRKTLKTDQSCSSRSGPLACQPLSKDYEIISKLMDRIKTLETSNRYHEKEIRDKDLRIKILDEKCNLYKTACEVKDVKYDKLKELENQCEKLENQIIEMENFLADYGLIWVGDKSFQYEPGEEQIPIDIPPGASSCRTTHRHFTIDYDKIFRNIDELNLMMNSDEIQIAMTAPQRVELKKQQAVPITFYSNGICIYSGPFRPFSDESTRQVVNDILDGYFPSELESRYPTGVPIDGIDRRNIMYDAKPLNVFQGPGRALGGNTSISKLTELETFESDTKRYDQPYTSVLTSNASTQLTMDQFLNKLPQNTISKDGKIFAIRNSIREALDNKCQTVMTTKIDTVGEQSKLFSPETMAKMKIRSLKGDKVYTVTLNRTDLIDNLYQKLCDICQFNRDSHVLVVSYPSRKVLSDYTLTIEQCGLAPTSSLHIETLIAP